MDTKELRRRFTAHDLSVAQAGRCVLVRRAGRKFAEDILDLVPESREQSLAITKIEEAVVWANMAISRREG